MTLPRHPLFRPRSVVGAIIAIIVLALWIGPSAQVRLDTGDVRFLYLGIPIVYSRQHEPERSQLLALASGPMGTKPIWAFSPMGSHNIDEMFAEEYFRAAAWVATDRQVARIWVHELAAGILQNPKAGPPGSILEEVEFSDDNGKMFIRPLWWQDKYVLDYLKSKGYVPPSQ